MEKLITMVIANPGENCQNEMNISYHTNVGNKTSFIWYRKKYTRIWYKAYPKMKEIDVFNNVYSINMDRTDKYENIVFLHCQVSLRNLEPNSIYIYRVEGDDKEYTFKTAPKDEFSFIWISDFHTYPLSPKRLQNASKLINRIGKKHKADFVFCSGDAIAWGGSYPFWEQFYEIPSIRKYMWANTLGNHDYMSRGYKKNTSEYFKETNYFPENGFDGEVGVCYFFKYANTLFIVLHNEHMGVYDVVNDEVIKAQKWVEEVIQNNPSEYIFLCQHYQWINGVNGKDRKFGYERWKDICDKYHIDLAIAANDHTYMKTYPIFRDEINENGTIYMQCPSCDGDRGESINPEIDNPKVSFRYGIGLKMIAGIYVEVKNDYVSTVLYDKNMNIIDSCIITKKERFSPNN